MDRVNEITNEVFTVLAQVRRADESSTVPEMLHGRMRSVVERAMRRAVELGLSQQDARDIGYVLVALTDEVVVGKGGSLREHWLPRALQLQLFNENVAGEGVFERLQHLLQDPSRAEVLRAYYLALLFGFQGKYGIRGGQVELADVTDRVADALRRNGQIREGGLSPEGARPREGGGRMRRSLPIVAISVAALVFALLIFVGLRVSLSVQSGQVVDRIEQASQAVQ